jgi:prepilin-type N-terminal cleavage/methylation domain-containing protein
MKKGFTVIELMVSMSMFLILIGVATGTFLETLRTQKIITELSAANNNATQAVEQISREIRTGYNFDQSAPPNILSFVNYKNEIVTYKLENNSIVRSNSGNAGNTITAQEVKVKRFNVYVITGANIMSRVTIIMSIEGPKNIDVNLQTTVSSRVKG